MISPITLFYSYAHEDELLRNQLEKHLSLLRRRGLITEWHDRQILAGEEWARDIDQHLETASIILLLISPDFLASDYCYNMEMQRAVARHESGEARVIPILLRPCDWHGTPFGQLQCLPRDGKAVTTWRNRDEAFLDIAQGLRGAIEQQTSSARLVPPPLSSVARQNRLRLLKRVRTTWIEGVLEHSLHQAALIALRLQEQPDALANPWHLDIQETNLPPHPLPAGTSIVQVYDDADGELLLLGEPGAGKTTLLLHLAQALLERAEHKEQECLPVIFNLSSWAQRRLPLSEWLVEELWSKYQVPRKVGQAWIDADQVLLLLDGLDEVAPEARGDCVEAINTYHRQQMERDLVPLVVCCRSQEYMTLSTRVALQQAVSIQPLTNEQIEQYLQSAAGQLEALQQALQEDRGLDELAHRPLMLSVFTLVYQGSVLKDLPIGETREVQQRHVFATYVERMLTHRAVWKQFPREHTMRWLTFLAAQMQQHHQTTFYLEYLQPDWLVDRRKRRLYQLLYGLVVGLVGGLAWELLGQGLNAGLVFGLGSGLLGWLLSGLLGGFSANQLDERLHLKPNQGIWHSARNGLVVGLLLWLVIGLVAGLLFRLDWGLLWGLVFGLLGGASIGLFGMEGQIEPQEVLMWSWKKVRSTAGLLWGLGFGLFSWLFVGLEYGRRFGLVVGLGNGLLSGLVVGLLGGLLGGFSANQLDERLHLKPNQGIWHSARNGLVIGLIIGLIIGLLCWLAFGLIEELVGGLVSGMFVGLLGDWLARGLLWGLLLGLLFLGLGAFLQHFTLRFFLWRTGCLPWNLVAFLDEAAERLLLRKVGGGYLFIHHLLLDYFASLETPSSEEASAVSVSLQKPDEKK